MIIEIVFFLFVLITLTAGFAIALTRNLMYAALGLFALLFGVAALFVFAEADFLAVSQLIVYVGGILILLIFGIMLTHRNLNEEPLTGITHPIVGFLIPFGIAAILGGIFMQEDWEKITQSHASLSPSPLSNIQIIGKEILSTYLLPFEILSVVLLIALVGAAFIARNSEKVK